MKRFLLVTMALILTIGILVSSTAAIAETEEWTCSQCGSVSSGNFCANCGAKKDAATASSAFKDGAYQLKLSIAFEENWLLSRYDVTLSLDNEPVGAIPHGETFDCVLNVDAGEHTLAFHKQDDSSVMGSTKIAVSKDTDWACVIHSHSDRIEIDGIKTNGDAVDTRFSKGQVAEIDGIQIALTGVKENKGSSYNKPESGNIFVLCEFELTNTSNEEVTISSMMCFSAYCDGYSVSSSLGATIEASKQLDGDIAAGKKMKGSVGFEVPKDWQEMEIHFSPSVWGSGEVVFVALRK